MRTCDSVSSEIGGMLLEGIEGYSFNTPISMKLEQERKKGVD